jgi:hypothetical protein
MSTTVGRCDAGILSGTHEKPRAMVAEFLHVLAEISLKLGVTK